MAPSTIHLICEICGGHFSLHSSRVANGRGRYCSLACRAKGLSIRYTGRKTNYKYPTGPEHPKWNGSRAPKPCPVCGTIFSSVNKTCSASCGHTLMGSKIRGAANPFRRVHPAKEKICRRCGRQFVRNQTTGEGSGKFYCSAACSVRHSHISLRATNIAARLMALGLEVMLEKSWSWLCHPDSKNRRMRIDIFLPALVVAIEYDGRQHREIAFAGGLEELAKIQTRDTLKERLLADHGIPLIRLSDWPIDAVMLAKRAADISPLYRRRRRSRGISYEQQHGLFSSHLAYRVD